MKPQRKEDKAAEDRTNMLIVLALMLAMLVLEVALTQARAEKPEGAPPSTPQEARFFKSAINSMHGSCCDEGDGYREGLKYSLDHVEGDARIVLAEWKASDDKPGEYDAKILGHWMHVDKEHVVVCGKESVRNQYEQERPCNPTGGAVVWLAFNWRNVQMNQLDKLSPSYVRCFAPGNMF
jgi:hypothetical protein